MIESGYQPRLVGFAGDLEISDPSALRLAIREELQVLKAVLGPRVTGFSRFGTGADLIFMRACVELRIPMILISPYPEKRVAEEFANTDEWIMAQHLIGVALAKYVAAEEMNTHGVHQHLLEFADVFLVATASKSVNETHPTCEILSETRALGIPTRIIQTDEYSANWSFDPDLERRARHGFETRKELLEFFDARLTTPFS